jgi:GNAT superfamily N-acetyltransferase
MEITVRRAEVSDVDALVRFNCAIAEETEGKKLSPDLLRAGVLSVFGDPSKGFYIVADIGGVPAGSLLVTPEWSDWRNSYYWWIQSVYVDPSHRKHGVYRKLHRHVEQLARSSGNVVGLRLYVDIGNSTAKAVYEKLGMARSRYEFFESGELTAPKRWRND